MLETAAMNREQRAMHALNRLAFGPRPGDFEHVRAVGVEAWIHQQLRPESIAIPDYLVERIDNLSSLNASPAALYLEYQRPLMLERRENPHDKAELRDIRRRRGNLVREAVEARLLRAIEGPRRLQEVMTAFWFNHFNIFAGKNLCEIWTGSFEEQAIRPHTLGRFRDLLGATARHPAMLFYLDNWQNTAPGSPGANQRLDGINENYARELMELHTLGVNGGYTQADVVALAHILTGWGLPRAGGAGGGGRRAGMRRSDENGVEVLRGAPFRLRRWMFGGAFNPPLRPRQPRPVTYGDGSAFYFDPTRHDFSSKVLLGRTIEGGGAREVEEALDLLARHPSTAKHLSYQLAQYFVADEPPPALVARMASSWRESDGDLREVLTAMFASAEFWEPRYFRAKYKTPYEYVISSVRAIGAPVRNFRPLAGTMAMLGMPLYGCQTPNGYADTQEAWLNPDSMMARLSFATALGSGNLPLEREPEDDGAGGNRGYFNKRGATNVSFDRGGMKMTPPDADALQIELGNTFSLRTREAIETAPPPLRAAMVLGSPEFMMR